MRYRGVVKRPWRVTSASPPRPCLLVAPILGGVGASSSPPNLRKWKGGCPCITHPSDVGLLKRKRETGRAAWAMRYRGVVKRPWRVTSASPPRPCLLVAPILGGVGASSSPPNLRKWKGGCPCITHPSDVGLLKRKRETGRAAWAMRYRGVVKRPWRVTSASHPRPCLLVAPILGGVGASSPPPQLAKMERWMSL